jgi:hypothetical protein
MSRTFKWGLLWVSVVACATATHKLGGPIATNQNSQTLWTVQQIYDGGPGSYGDGGPFSYADGGPYQTTDAGYFCDGGYWNPGGCYTNTFDGGPLTLDAGPVTYDGGPYLYDAGVNLPFALLDGGATSVVVWTPQYTHLSWVGTVSTDGGQDAYGNIALYATNDGNDFVRLTTPTPVQLNQDGGAGQSSLTYSLDLTPFNDYLGVKLVFLEDGGSSGVLSGNWFTKE